MSRRKLPRSKKVKINTAILIALIGLVGTGITAYFSYLSNMRPTELAISATQTANNFNNHYISSNSPITFLPIPDKDLLIKKFKLEGLGTRVNLRFVANNFDLDFYFSAPLDMECYALVNNLTEHFALDKHLEVDMSQFPTGHYNSYWDQRWLPIINGAVVDPCFNQTLRDMAVTDGDLIGLKIKWVLYTLISEIIIPTSSEGTPTPLPTNTPVPIVSPPDIFP